MGIQLHLQALTKDNYIRAEDIVDFIRTPDIQDYLGKRQTNISVRTAWCWLRRLDWRYQKKKMVMYLDGHEREDVVTYRKAFLERWAEYEKWMVTYDKDGLVNTSPTGFAVPGGCFRLVLVTHNESTFYANDRCKTRWTHASETPTPERKGEGTSLMVSDFLVPEWGQLKDDKE